MNWIKVSKNDTAAKKIVTYWLAGSGLSIKSIGSETFVVLREGEELKKCQTLKEAKEFAEVEVK